MGFLLNSQAPSRCGSHETGDPAAAKGHDDLSNCHFDAISNYPEMGDLVAAERSSLVCVTGLRALLGDFPPQVSDALSNCDTCATYLPQRDFRELSITLCSLHSV